MTLRVLLADDHGMMRDGLKLILSQLPTMTVIGEASTGYEALDMARRLQPDIIIMDIGMPDLNGVEAARQIRAADPGVKIMALTALPDPRYILAMLEAGARGYLLKGSAGDELLQAMRVVANGGRFISPEAEAALARHRVSANRAKQASFPVLAAREREILQRLAEGQTSKEIAAHLGISVRTVETHRRNIMLKLGLDGVADLTRYAIREGLVQPDR